MRAHPLLLSGAHRTRVAILGGSALLFFYAWVLFGHVATAVGDPESSGNFNGARMIASRTAVLKLPVFERLGLDREESGLVVPAGFVKGERPGTAVPSGPPGFPLHVAGVALLFGWTGAPFFVTPIAALLSLELVYVIARELKLSRLASVTATAVFGACPLLILPSIRQVGDVVGTFWCLASIAAALVTRRGSAVWAFAAGLALGVAVLVWPGSVVILPAVLIALRWRRTTVPLFAFGALPPFLALGLYDHAVHGRWTRAGEQIGAWLAASTPGLLAGRLASDSGALSRAMTPLVLFGALAANVDRKVAPRDRILLLLWWSGFFLLPSFQSPSGGSHLRHLLPAIPAMVIASLLAWRDFIAHPLGGRQRTALAGALSAAALAIVLVFEARAVLSRRILETGRRQNVYATAAHWAQRYVPDEGLVLSAELSGALAFYSDRVPVRWDRLDRSAFERLRDRADARGYRWYALLMPDEVDAAQRAAPGDWAEISQVPDAKATLWRVEKN